jgi:uncharacterized protein YraI
MLRNLVIMSLAAASAAAPVSAKSTGDLLHLRVGPGVSASFTTATMRVSCGDNADCVFSVAPNSTFDVIARAPRGHNLQWAGCTPLPEANTCRVEIHDEPALVSVR